MSETTHVTKPNGGNLRRWLDKVLIGTVSLLIALAIGAYSATSHAIVRVQETQVEQVQRIRALEEGRKESTERLNRIETKIDRIFEKVK